MPGVLPAVGSGTTDATGLGGGALIMGVGIGGDVICGVTLGVGTAVAVGEPVGPP